MVCLWAISCNEQNTDSAIPTKATTIKPTAPNNSDIDTIWLRDFTANKLIAYKLAGATIYVDYNTYLKSSEVFWRRYKEGISELEKEQTSSENSDSMYRVRWRVVDSVYKEIQSLSKKTDTI